MKNKNLFIVLSILLVIATFFVFRQKAITLSDTTSTLICEIEDEEHIHGQSCYLQEEIEQDENINYIQKDGLSLEKAEDVEVLEGVEDSQNIDDEVNVTLEQVQDEQVLENETITPNDTTVKLDETSANEENLTSKYITLDKDVTLNTNDTYINIFVNLNNEWVLIGNLETNVLNTNYIVPKNNINALVSEKLKLSLDDTTYTIYYTIGQANNYIKATTQLSNINLGTNKAFKNVYLTSQIQSNISNLDDNVLKIYSVELYDVNKNLKDTKYVLSTGNNVATFALPTDNNYIYVDENGNVLNNVIDVVGPTKVYENNKYTVTLNYVDSSKNTTVQTGNKFTLPEGYWLVNGTEKQAGSVITITEDTTLNQVGVTITLKIKDLLQEIQWAKGLNYILGDSKYLVNGEAVPASLNEIAINSPTYIEEIDEVTVIYNINKPTTYNQTALSYEGTYIAKVNGSEMYETTTSTDIIVEDVDVDYMTPFASDTSAWTKYLYKFQGWTLPNSTVIQPGTELTYAQLKQYATNGSVTLKAKWEKQAARNSANYFLNNASEVRPGWGIEPVSDYTPSLWCSYVGNPPSILSNISGTGADAKIRALEGNKGDGKTYLLNFPNDDDIFNQLKKYATQLTVEGQQVSTDELDSQHFEINWTVFKYSLDSWHIDGVLVRKKGKMKVTKEFRGSQIAITNVLNTFSIAQNENDELKQTLTVANATNKIVDDQSITYEWEVDVKYGFKYTFIESGYQYKNYRVETNYMISDPFLTKYRKFYNDDGTYYYQQDEDGNWILEYGNQTTDTWINSNQADVFGVNNYTGNGQITKQIVLSFSNIYYPNSAIDIKKTDNLTGDGLEGVEFQLYLKEGELYSKLAKFDLENSIYTYSEEGQLDVLTSLVNGSIILNKLPSGEYKLIETKPLDGYIQSSNSTFTIENNGESIEILDVVPGDGNSFEDRTLQVTNKSQLKDLTLTKTWDQIVPEKYVKDILIELYMNGNPASTYNLNTDINGDGVVDENDADMLKPFTLALNQNDIYTNSYTWKNMPSTLDGQPIIYSIREWKIGNIEAVGPGQYDIQTGKWQSMDAYSQYVAISNPQTVNANSINISLENSIDFIKITINKTNALGQGLAGATFEIEEVDTNGNTNPTFEKKTETSSDTGLLTFVDLNYETLYKISETQAPAGYYAYAEPIYVMINKSQTEDTLTLYKILEGQLVEADNSDFDYISLNSTQTVLNVIDINHTKLPKAGGIGNYWFYAIGLIIMVFTAMLKIRNVRNNK